MRDQMTSNREAELPAPTRIGSGDWLDPKPRTHIVSFSFGQTSGYMLRRLMDAHAKDFDKKFSVIYDNTGREYNETLDFGHEVETRWGVPIIWLEYCRVNGEHSVKVVNYETAARRDDKRPGPFDEMNEWAGTLPNVRGRGCSGQLKVRTTKRYLKTLGLESWTSYVGIRADESDRAGEIMCQCPKCITPQFPLIDARVTHKMVDDWWDTQPFKLNLPNFKGNCDLCFLKAKWKRLSIMRTEPEAAQWWIGWERRKEAEMKAAAKPTSGARWIDGVTYEGLLAESQHPELDFSEQDIPCSCAVGGYREAADEGSNTKLTDSPTK